MRAFKSLIRISVRLFVALVGLSLLGYLVFRTGPGVVWGEIQAIRWGLALIIIVGGLSQMVKTCAWRQTLTCDVRRLSWSRSFGAQLASDAIGQLGIAGKLVGEGMRISLVGSAVPLPRVISAGAIDGGLHTLTAAVLTVFGIVATLLLAPLPARWRVYALLLAGILGALVMLAAVAVASRWKLVGNLARAIGRVPMLHNWMRDKQPIIDSAENNLLTFYREAPAAFCASLLFNVLWHVLAVLEVFLIMRFLGARIAVTGAFVLEGLTKVINLVGAFNPGNFGTYEAGNMLIAKMFGVTGTTGLTLALCRRARAVFWAGVGALCIIVMKRRELPETNQEVFQE